MVKRKTDVDCPMGMLMRLLSGPWTIYILWILGEHGPMRFGSLKRQIEGVSSKVLTERLRMLEEAGLVYREYEPTIPPQVTYGITARMHELTPVLNQVAAIACRWYGEDSDATAKDAWGSAASAPS
jgi:DNA-binding HxlR family transcriptional regulator